MIQLRDIPKNIDDKQRDIIEEHNRVMFSIKQLVKSMLDNGKDAEDIAELCWFCGFNYAQDYFIKEDMLRPRKNNK